MREVAARLKATQREADLVARVGGDEFVVLAPTCGSSEDAERFAERIGNALSAPFRIGEREVQVSCSIGVSLYPDHALNSKDLLASADLAMYQAKRAGRNRHALARPL